MESGAGVKGLALDSHVLSSKGMKANMYVKVLTEVKGG